MEVNISHISGTVGDLFTKFSENSRYVSFSLGKVHLFSDIPKLQKYEVKKIRWDFFSTYIYIYIYIYYLKSLFILYIYFVYHVQKCQNINNKTFIYRWVIFRFLPNLRRFNYRRIFEGLPKYNSRRSVCMFVCMFVCIYVYLYVCI